MFTQKYAIQFYEVKYHKQHLFGELPFIKFAVKTLWIMSRISESKILMKCKGNNIFIDIGTYYMNCGYAKK